MRRGVRCLTLMLTEQEAQFYERLASEHFWRIRCGNCRCPHWAHMRPESTWGFGCACGNCPKFQPRREDIPHERIDNLP